MSDRFNPNSFAPFLDAMRSRPASPAPSAVAGPAALDVLKMLEHADGKQMEISEFLRHSGLGLEDFYSAMKAFEGAGLIARLSADGLERVVLTPAGEQITGLRL